MAWGHDVSTLERAVRILCLNSGSSSLKFSLYALAHGSETLVSAGAVERIGLGEGVFWLRDGAGSELERTLGDFPDCRRAIEGAFDAFHRHGSGSVNAVGHRVVHGGATHSRPERVTPALLTELKGLVPLAPLHLPSAIQAIESVSAHFPDLPQVACFDTAFHRRMPELAQRLPLPQELWEEGVRRYGFHGLSYEYVLGELGPRADERIIIAHLGNGASLAAVRGDQPIDTTMGFTPAAGLMMGTRAGDLDPGVLLYLINEKAYEAGELERLVNEESGLLGVSGLTSDMKTLLERRATSPAAARAVALFCYQARKHIGALAAVLGGLDTLVFTGGIGERAAVVRQEICNGLEPLGVTLDPTRVDDVVLSAAGSPCTVRVIATNEDLMIARHTRKTFRW
jgi:acetate kinase